jgi:hypothetical protein
VKKTLPTLDSASAEPLGQTRALEHARDPLADQRGQRRRLEDHAVAGHQRQPHLAHRDAPRVVPGRDDPDHPERLVHERRALGLQEPLRHRDLLLGEDLGAGAGDPLQRIDRRQDLHRERLGPRLSLLAREQVADIVVLVEQHLGGALEVASALLEGELAPGVLGLGDGVDDGLDVLGRGDRNRPDRLAGGRVERLELPVGSDSGGFHRPEVSRY